MGRGRGARMAIELANGLLVSSVRAGNQSNADWGRGAHHHAQFKESMSFTAL